MQFSYSTFGKPYLEQELYGNLCFNLSHSDGLALLAVARGRKLGIDVERIRPEIIKENVAEHFFSPEEVTKLRSLPVDQQAEAFFNCWTRKEAYIKARGEGLSIPLDQFNVSLMPGEPAALLEMKIDPEEVNRWHMMELVSGSNFKAADERQLEGASSLLVQKAILR